MEAQPPSVDGITAEQKQARLNMVNMSGDMTRYGRDTPQLIQKIRDLMNERDIELSRLSLTSLPNFGKDLGFRSVILTEITDLEETTQTNTRDFFLNGSETLKQLNLGDIEHIIVAPHSEDSLSQASLNISFVGPITKSITLERFGIKGPEITLTAPWIVVRNGDTLERIRIGPGCKSLTIVDVESLETVDIDDPSTLESVRFEHLPNLQQHTSLPDTVERSGEFFTESSPNGELLASALQGNLEGVRDALAAGADPNARQDDDYRNTALGLASSRDENVQIVRVLLAAGADPSLNNTGGLNALEMAIEFGSENIRRILESHMGIPGGNSGGQIEMDLHAERDSAIRAGITSGTIHPNYVTYGDQLPLLSWYATMGNSDMIRFLLENGANPNQLAGPTSDSPGSRPLDYADGCPACQRAIRDHGGVLATAPPATSEQDRILQDAVLGDDDEAARTAIRAGANPNRMLDGNRETILIHYAGTDNMVMVRFLLENGASVNGRAGPLADMPGDTAVNYATLPDIVDALRAAGGLSRWELEPGTAPVNRQVLRGVEDLNIKPITLEYPYVSGADETVTWETIDVKEVFVAKLGRDLTLDQFLRKYMGDGIVVKVGSKFYGIERKDLMQEYTEGSAIAYECTKTFVYDPPQSLGTFEYSDIYGQAFSALRTPAGVFYIRLSMMKTILSTPHAFYTMADKPDRKLENVASRSSVLAGGPVQSQLHCQAGSGENLYSISPFRLPEIEEEEEEEEEEPNVVFVKKGEEKTEFPLDLSQTVLQLKEAVKEKLGIAVDAQKMVFQGKVLKDDQTLGDAKVGKGYVIQLQVSGGRKKRNTLRKKKAQRKTMKSRK